MDIYGGFWKDTSVGPRGRVSRARPAHCTVLLCTFQDASRLNISSWDGRARQTLLSHYMICWPGAAHLGILVGAIQTTATSPHAFSCGSQMWLSRAMAVEIYKPPQSLTIQTAEVSRATELAPLRKKLVWTWFFGTGFWANRPHFPHLTTVAATVSPASPAQATATVHSHSTCSWTIEKHMIFV